MTDHFENQKSPFAVMIQNLNAFYGKTHAIRDISLDVSSLSVTAVIGPSGCGKSTFIRCINRIHETIPGAKVSGRVMIDGKNIYEHDIDPVQIRRKVGMVFQKPNPFPTMSIHDNVIAGLKLNSTGNKSEYAKVVERCLKKTGLWNEAKDDLSKSGASL